MTKFSHLSEDGKPGMVDVSGKTLTKRSATATSTVVLPPEVLTHFQNGDLNTKKGPVFQTAIIAGTMATKRTGDLIPLCHPLGLESCKITIEFNEQQEVVIVCQTSITAKTGVEMEALTGATVAALTIYDMCKVFSQDIVIKETKLLAKTGGKHDFIRA